MAELIKIKFKDLDVTKFLEYVEISNIKEKQILEIYRDKIYSKGHNMTRTFVKYVEIETNLIFSSIEFPDDDIEKLLLPFNDLKKLIEMLKIYLLRSKSGVEVSKVNGVIECKLDKDNNRYIGCTMQLKSAKMSTKINLGEVSMIHYLSNDVFNKISSTENYSYKFLITDEDLNEISKLLKFENEVVKNAIKEVKKFIIEFDKNNQVLFKSFDGKWETKYDVEMKISENKKLVITTLIIEKSNNNEIHDFYLIKSPVNGAYCIVAEEFKKDKEIKIKYLTVSQEYDPNAK